MSPSPAPALRRAESETRRTHREHLACHVSDGPDRQCSRFANARDFAVLHGADMPSSTRASPHPSPARRARTPAILSACALMRSSCERLYFLYFTRSIRRRRQTHGGRGRAATPRPPYDPHALPPSPRERLHFLYFTRSTRRWHQTHGGRGRAATPLRTSRAPSRHRRASVYTSYTSLARHAADARHAKGWDVPPPPPSVRPARPPAIAARASILPILHSPDTPRTPDAQRAGNGPSHSPPPLRVQLKPLARQGLRSA